MPVPLPPNAKQVFKGKLHQVWEWDQKLFDGTHATFSSLVREDTVAAIAFLDPHTILLQQEYQPGREAPFFDVPGGCVDPGESPEAAIRRELLEETGYATNEITLFRTKKFAGMTHFVEHTFLAKNLAGHAMDHADPGERITLKPTPWKDAVALCLRGELRRQDAMLAILAMEFDPEARVLKQHFLQGE